MNKCLLKQSGILWNYLLLMVQCFLIFIQFPKDLTRRMIATIYIQKIFFLLKYKLKGFFFNYNPETATSGHLLYKVK